MATETENPPDPPYALGILLVHGIGLQRRGETLVQWGDAIVDALNRSTPEDILVEVESASVATGEIGETPAHAVLHLRLGKDHEERWLLADAWWAETFAAPSYGELVSGSFRAVPWAFASHFAHVYRERAQRIKRRVLHPLLWLEAALRLTIGFVLAPLVVLLLMLLLLLGALPIPAVRSFVRGAQRLLAGTVGDSLVFLESPVRAAAIRARVTDALDWLQAHGCAQTAVLAHSQGAAVALEALNVLAAHPPPVAEGQIAMPFAPHSPNRVVDLLVTFGAGINKLALLKRWIRRPGAQGQGDRVRDPFADLAVTATATLPIALGLIVWLWIEVARGRLQLIQLLLFPSLLVLVSILISWLIELARWLAKRKPSWKEHVSRATVAAAVLLMVGTMGAMFAQENRAVVPTIAFVLTLLPGVAALKGLLSNEFAAAIRARIHRPDIVRAWHDFYASADPVPSGATHSTEPDVPESVRIWNSSSLLADHTTYWRNRDGFVIQVVDLLCRDHALLHGHMPDTYNEQRAKWRVSWLLFARWSLPIVGLALAFLHRGRIAEGWRLMVLSLHGSPLSLPSWVPIVNGEPAIAGLGLALGALASWLAYVLIRWLWRGWCSMEQEQVLAHKRPSGMPERFWLFAVTLCVAFGTPLAFVVTECLALDATTPVLLFSAPVISGFWGPAAIWLFGKWRPPPA